MAHDSHNDSPRPNGDSEGRFDSMDIANPASAYLFLSDDAQDEIIGSGKKRMKCLFCGHRFVGESYDRCPECFSSDTEEKIPIIDG
jgi:hypothetical protein